MTDEAITAWVDSIERDVMEMAYFELGKCVLRSARWDVLTSYASGSRFRNLSPVLVEEFAAGKL